MSSAWHLYWFFVDLLSHFSFYQYFLSFLSFNTTLSISSSLCCLPLMWHFEGTSLKWKIITSPVLQQGAAMLHKPACALLCKERRLHKWLTFCSLETVKTLQPVDIKEDNELAGCSGASGPWWRQPGCTQKDHIAMKTLLSKESFSLCYMLIDLLHFNFMRRFVFYINDSNVFELWQDVMEASTTVCPFYRLWPKCKFTHAECWIEV